MPPPFTRFNSARHRKTVLQVLQDADNWVLIDSIHQVSYPRPILYHLRRLGMVEVEKRRDGDYAKITPFGNKCLAEGTLVGKDIKVSMPIRLDIKGGLEDLAKELGMRNSKGEGSIPLLLRAVLGRREAFARWYRNI